MLANAFHCAALLGVSGESSADDKTNCRRQPQLASRGNKKQVSVKRPSRACLRLIPGILREFVYLTVQSFNENWTRTMVTSQVSQIYSYVHG